jgi:hypothetical protein
MNLVADCIATSSALSSPTIVFSLLSGSLNLLLCLLPRFGPCVTSAAAAHFCLQPLYCLPCALFLEHASQSGIVDLQVPGPIIELQDYFFGAVMAGHQSFFCFCFFF